MICAVFVDVSGPVYVWGDIQEGFLWCPTALVKQGQPFSASVVTLQYVDHQIGPELI
jgi:hypothetical protein